MSHGCELTVHDPPALQSFRLEQRVGLALGFCFRSVGYRRGDTTFQAISARRHSDQRSPVSGRIPYTLYVIEDYRMKAYPTAINATKAMQTTAIIQWMSACSGCTAC